GKEAAAAAAAGVSRATASFADGGWSLLRSASASAAAARCLVGKREQHLDLGVLGKSFRPRQGKRAPRAIHSVGAGPERTAGAVDIPQQKVGGIDEHVAARFRRDGEAPQHGGGKRILDRLPLGRIGARRAERFVSLSQEHLWSDSAERDHAALAALAAI